MVPYTSPNVAINVTDERRLCFKSRRPFQIATSAVAAPEAPSVGSNVTPDEAILKAYKRLQNGSDVRGIAVEGRLLPSRASALLGDADNGVGRDIDFVDYVLQECREKLRTSPQL